MPVRSSQTIQRVLLDDHVVVSVPVATNRVTTIGFPGPIAAIDASGVTVDGKTPGEFQLAHTKGSSFLSVRALWAKATGNLNIRWNKRTYVFELFESSRPILSLVMETQPTGKAKPAPELTRCSYWPCSTKPKLLHCLNSNSPTVSPGWSKTNRTKQV